MLKKKYKISDDGAIENVNVNDLSEDYVSSIEK